MHQAGAQEDFMYHLRAVVHLSQALVPAYDQSLTLQMIVDSNKSSNSTNEINTIGGKFPEKEGKFICSFIEKSEALKL